MLFDVRAAKALKAGEHLTVDGMPGLRLMATGAARFWAYRYKSPLDGLMKRIRIGSWPTMSAAQAGVEWERLKGIRDSGRDPGQEKKEAKQTAVEQARQAKPEEDTVGALLDRFVKWARKRRAERGGNELERLFSRMLNDKFRALQPAKVTRTVAFELISSHASTPVVAANLRRELGAAWEHAHDAGRLADDIPNWWRQILRGKLQSKGKIVGGEHQGQIKRALSAEEVGAVLRHLQHVSKMPAELLTLYLWTGCRGAELVEMEGRELVEDAAGVLWWIIPRAKVKMARHPLAIDLPVPMLGRARSIVLGRRDAHGDGYLFPSPGKSGHVEQKAVGVAVYWHMPRCTIRPEQVRQRWPVVDWSPHDLRRTVRTQLARLKCPEDIGEAVLGHIDSDVGTYNRHEYREERLHWLGEVVKSWEQACHR